MKSALNVEEKGIKTTAIAALARESCQKHAKNKSIFRKELQMKQC